MNLTSISGLIGFILGGPSGARAGVAAAGIIDPGKPIPRTFGMVEVTCLGDTERRFVPGLLDLALGPPVGECEFTASGKCASCGSREYVKHRGRSVCSYCRCAA